MSSFTGTSIPPGWLYSAAKDGYQGPNGQFISNLDIAVDGSFTKAFAKKYGGAGGVTGAGNNAANPFMNAPMATNIPNASISNGSLSVGNQTQSYTFHSPPNNVIQIETKVGRVGINIETGDMTVPVGIGRDDAIREFWFGFQKHFRPSNKLKYEQEIYDLKKELASVKSSAVLMKQQGEKEANKRVAEKIRKKYNGEKFIMLKPEDLIRFIEEA